MAEIKSVWTCYGIQEVIQYSPKRRPSDEEVISIVRTYLSASGLRHHLAVCLGLSARQDARTSVLGVRSPYREGLHQEGATISTEV